MNYAIILSGGTGTRMNLKIPKQYIKIKGQEIILYTLQKINENENIDRIIIVCNSIYRSLLEKQMKKYGIKKFFVFAEGGKNVFESTLNGLLAIKDFAKSNDSVLVHDAVRPMINNQIIDNLFDCQKLYPNVVLSTPLRETLVITKDMKSTNSYIDRSTVLKVQTPQLYLYKDLVNCYEIAKRLKISDCTYINTLMLDCGYELHFAEGSELNIKITKQDDLNLFSALLDSSFKIDNIS